MDGVGIVGGGHAGLRLFELFHQSAIAPVAFVVDPRPDAPAVLAALKARVPVFPDAARALAANRVRYLFEVTGSTEIEGALRERCPSGTDLVTHETAALILSAIEESHRSITRGVVTDVTEIKTQIDRSLADMHELLEAVDSVTGDMQMLALNARIEAARVGEQGRGFAVVAKEMATSTETIRQTAEQLQRLNGGIKSVSAGIDAALGSLN